MRKRIKFSSKEMIMYHSIFAQLELCPVEGEWEDAIEILSEGQLNFIVSKDRPRHTFLEQIEPHAITYIDKILLGIN